MATELTKLAEKELKGKMSQSLTCLNVMLTLADCAMCCMMDELLSTGPLTVKGSSNMSTNGSIS